MWANGTEFLIMSQALEMGGVNFEDTYNRSASFPLLTVKKKVEHSILQEFSGDLYLGTMKLLKLFAKLFAKCYALSLFWEGAKKTHNVYQTFKGFCDSQNLRITHLVLSVIQQRNTF